MDNGQIYKWIFDRQIDGHKNISNVNDDGNNKRVRSVILQIKNLDRQTDRKIGI